MMINTILTYLDELYPNPKCELNYQKDYELLLAIVMSAQTTDKRVNEVNKILFSKYPSPEELNKASEEEIEKIIKPIGTYKKKAKYIKEIISRLIQDNSLPIPPDEKYLETLPGVGRKTINVFLSELYNKPLIAVDTHVERVSKRLSLSDTTDNVLLVEEKLNKQIKNSQKAKVHKQMVLFGRYKCKAIHPLCTDCKLKNICKYYKEKNIVFINKK